MFDEQNPSSAQPTDPSLELRSDAPQPPVSPKSWRQVLMAVGAIVVLILLGLGVYAAISPRRGGLASDDSLFGSLPFNEDRENQPSSTISGLSGIACEHPDRRAIGVMLAGDPINRPMSGFSKADMVWELPVLTSNVTRLLAVYQCGEPTDIGSVRSTRHDYLFLADGIDTIMAHWGGSYHALNRITVGEFQTINALTNPFDAYFRKSHLPAPYNGFTTYERLWNALQKLGYRTTTNFKGYQFKDDAPQAERPAGGTLRVAWPGQFAVSYEYDPVRNRYLRYWAGTQQIDAEDNQPVAPSVVAIMRATNEFADGPGGYNDVGIEGEGQLEVYQDGTVIKGTWRKNPLDPKDPVHFLNEQGQEIVFTRGQVWVMTPDASIAVTWEPAAAATPTATPSP